LNIERRPVIHTASDEGDTTMSPPIGKQPCQSHLDLYEKYAKGEPEAVGSWQLLGATPRGVNFITGIVDLYAALGGGAQQQLID
jgi:hypothetical protein